MKQEIIFRFTIPNDTASSPLVPDLSHANFNGVPPSEYFTVSAFGQDYLVEFPSGIVGLRRPCANSLGFIVLPTYYEAPQVEELDCDDGDNTSHKRYRVQIPPEIAPGETFYASLPGDAEIPLQVRLVAPYNNPHTTTMLEFEAPPEQTIRQAADPFSIGIQCRWKVPKPCQTSLQVTIPKGIILPSQTNLKWDQTPYFLTRIGSVPAVATRPSTKGDSAITFTVPLRQLPTVPARRLNLVHSGRNHGIQLQGSLFGEWHRLYHITKERLQWFYLLPQQQSQDTDIRRVLAKQTPPAFCCCLMETRRKYSPRSSQELLPHTKDNEENQPNRPDPSCTNTNNNNNNNNSFSKKPLPPTKRSPWQLVPVLEAPGLSTILASPDRKTLDGKPQVIGTFWELATLYERQRQDYISTKWRMKLQGEGSGTTTIHLDENTITAAMDNDNDDSAATKSFLESICQAIDAQLCTPRLLREPWELNVATTSFFGKGTKDWRRELTERLVCQELVPTPRNPQRFEFHAHSRLSHCRLLGLLVGKSLVEGNRPLFSKQFQLATYLYKHMLQWPIHRQDYIDVMGVTSSTLDQQQVADSDDDMMSQLLQDRLFETTKNAISSFLDGVFTIVPQSFVFVFRSMDELEACLVADSWCDPSILATDPALATVNNDIDQ